MGGVGGGLVENGEEGAVDELDAAGLQLGLAPQVVEEGRELGLVKHRHGLCSVVLVLTVRFPSLHHSFPLVSLVLINQARLVTLRCRYAQLVILSPISSGVLMHSSLCSGAGPRCSLDPDTTRLNLSHVTLQLPL